MTVAAPLTSSAFLAPLVADLQQSIANVSTTTQRVASGSRILTAGDDVSAVSIAAGLQAQNASLKQAISSVAQGTSLLQVASAALTEINGFVSNLQSIAQQADSVALTATQRAFLNEQFTQNLNGIDNIAGNTSFNGLNLLDGTLAGGISIRIGPQPDNVANITIGSAKTSALFGDALPDVGSEADAAAAQTAVTSASNVLQGIISTVTGLETGFMAASNSLNLSLGGVTTASDDLTNTNASDAMLLAQQAIIANVAVAISAQATALPQTLLAILQPTSTQSTPPPANPAPTQKH